MGKICDFPQTREDSSTEATNKFAEEIELRRKSNAIKMDIYSNHPTLLKKFFKIPVFKKAFLTKC
ncbi:MAG: hypothetical protein LBS83_01670 [Holosporales bacterium]|nr:hypothetical protein [Holosporales bacterium]